MSRAFKDIVAEVLALPVSDRAQLASELLGSLETLSESEYDELWAEEAARRYADYKADRIEAIAAEEVFARLRARRNR